jgi:hypothetical protein
MGKKRGTLQAVPKPMQDTDPRAAQGLRNPEVSASDRRMFEDVCGDFGLSIRRDGTWFYRGSPIGRKPLVRLFASVLQRDDAGAYWLVTPAEKGRIAVEDVPFVAVEAGIIGAGREQTVTLRTNLDEIVTVGREHPLRVETDASGAPAPYVLVRDRLEARLLRPVFYDLVEHGEERSEGEGRILGIWSEGEFFRLGALDGRASGASAA